MSKFKKTSFNPLWCLDPALSWVQEAPDDKFSVICSLCRTKICLSNMGKQALTSHMAGKRHKTSESNIKGTLSLKLFLKKSPPECRSVVETATSSASISECMPKPLVGGNISPKSAVCTVSSVGESSGNLVTEETQQRSRILQSFLLGESVTKAEILWCMQCIIHHSSLRTIASGISLFKQMFPDSAIASKVQLQKTKAAYVIVHGLAPYFEREVKTLLSHTNHMVVGFDESFNKISQKQQMDIVVRFWNNSKGEVSTRYLTSVFLGHTTSSDLLTAFKNGLANVDLKKVVQVGMDGPNVNIKFLRDLKSELLDVCPENGKLLDMGSCGLHTLHCAFKGGIKATNWKLVEFLRALYNLWKAVPARRADYIAITRSTLFPLKFCAIRWLENAKVAERAFIILPNVLKFVNEVKGKNEPKCNSFKVISEALKDKLLGPKLAFFQSLASDIEPFLREFQSNDPLGPFLYNALTTLVKRAMEKIVKPEILSTSVSKIDILKKENLLFDKEIDIGYATKDALRKLKCVPDRELLQFRMECRKCLQAFVSKIMIRSPLNYELTKSISCFDPAVAIRTEIANKRLSDALQMYVAYNWLTGMTADKVDREFKQFCSIPAVKDTFTTFNRIETRLDHFWIKLFETHSFSETEHLEAFLKIVLIISHGNAALERGFSINKECIVENQKAESLIAQRHIFDAVTAAGGVEAVVISKEMIHFVRNAHSRNKEALQRQQQENEETQKCANEKKRAAKALKELEAKKRKLMEEATREVALIEDQMQALKK